MAACWSCHFQRGCARRALAQPLPEFGIWGGYRLAPGRA
ncbi:transcription factor WhiB domain protein [Mycobacterium xenopi 3993]|nr:transcription factor WhiB domain protein [Mycobacterium xenopi 3993]